MDTITRQGGNFPNQFNTLTDVAVSPDFIYMADHGNDRVKLLNHQGMYVTQIGYPNPTSVVLYDDLIFVGGMTSIGIFDLNLELISTFGKSEIEIGEFSSIRYFDVNGSHIFAPDDVQGRLQIWTTSEPGQSVLTETITITSTMENTIPEASTHVITQTQMITDAVGTANTLTVTEEIGTITVLSTVTDTETNDLNISLGPILVSLLFLGKIKFKRQS